jgi:hypothetical protein|tara:strand:+ start:889 stop:990 length:102 start_codon:yes stop_codon:yes gene_type:complete
MKWIMNKTKRIIEVLEKYEEKFRNKLKNIKYRI